MSGTPSIVLAGDGQNAEDRGSSAVSVILSDRQRGFIASSSLVFVMSGAPDVPPDVSPRGDAPGFVRVIGSKILQLPDRVGNNRIDTIRNVVQDPRVALVFVKARDNRILVVEGNGINRSDPELLAEFEINGRLPRSVMEIEVVAARLEASAAIDISGLWHPDMARVGTNFSLGAALAGQLGGDVALTERLVEEDYKSKLY